MNPTKPTNRPTATRSRPLRIVTASTTVADFIHRFCRVVDQRTMVVALEQPRPPGTEVQFSVRLADGTPVFQGVGRIQAVKPRERATGVAATIELDELDDHSRTMHRCLLIAARRIPVPRPRGTAPPPPGDDRPSLLPAPAVEVARFQRHLLPLPPPPAEPRPLTDAEMWAPHNPLGEIADEVLDHFVESAIAGLAPVEHAAPSPDGAPPDPPPAAPAIAAPSIATRADAPAHDAFDGPPAATLPPALPRLLVSLVAALAIVVLLGYLVA